MRCHESMILQGLGMPSGRWKQRPLWRQIVSGNPKVKVCNHSLPSRSVYDMKLAIPNILKKQHFGADHQLIPQTEPLQGAKKATKNGLQGEKSKTIYWSARWWFQKRTNHPHLGVSKNSGTPKWEIPIKMDDLGVPPFLETSTWGNWSNLPIFQMGWLKPRTSKDVLLGREAPAEKRDVSVTVRKARPA